MPGEPEDLTADAQLAHEDELLQQRKLAALGMLTCSIAHELQSPLNNISLTVETLLDDFDQLGQERKRKLLEEIFTQVQRASATVRNLLNFTCRDRPVFTSVPVSELLEASLKLARNELTLAHVKPELSVAADLPPVKGNPGNLQQVFLNLFLNAVEAMPGGGTLRVAAECQARFVRIAVQDTGAGIAPEHIGKVFEPFFTTKEAGEGTGLGLFVSHSIVQKHGGRLEVESQPGKGTTFYVMLPANCGGR